MKPKVYAEIPYEVDKLCFTCLTECPFGHVAKIAPLEDVKIGSLLCRICEYNEGFCFRKVRCSHPEAIK